MVMDKTMTISENSHDSEQNLRWLEWERKNKRQNRIAQKRMTLVCIVAGAILLIWILSAWRRISERANFVGKRPTVAYQWRTDPLQYRPERGYAQPLLQTGGRGAVEWISGGGPRGVGKSAIEERRVYAQGL